MNIFLAYKVEQLFYMSYKVDYLIQSYSNQIKVNLLILRTTF